MNHNNYIVFDLETDDSNPRKANPIQIAAIVLNPRTLKKIPGSEFNAFIRPDDIEDPNYYQEHLSTLEFHARKYQITPEEMYEKIKGYMPEKMVWKQFIDYAKSWYRDGKTSSGKCAPIFCGFNIDNFDWPIILRLCNKYKSLNKEGRPKFASIYTIDIIKMVFLWNEDLTEFTEYNMDYLREKLGIDNPGLSHEALKDCHDEADLFVKYLLLHRAMTHNVKGWR